MQLQVPSTGEDLNLPIELLEQGRAVLWSKLRGYRHPLDKLRTIDRELFDRFETLSGQLECLSMSVDGIRIIRI